MVNVLLVGNAAREHVIAAAFKKNPNVKLFAYMSACNPGIAALSELYEIGIYSDLEKIKKFASENKIDLGFVGPEDPLSKGVVDALASINIPAVGPVKELAKLETSKSFTRDLLKKYGIEGSPEYGVFTKDDLDELKRFIETLDGIVIKPDGLTGGKGVMVQGDHFNSKEEAFAICKKILEKDPKIVIEEKLEGEEFSLQCLTDGITVLPTPVAQDHKRAFEDDKGPNTGGMGSYTFEDHSLPFLEQADLDNALSITKQVADALYKETGTYYKGVMYGGFMKTKNGVKLIEYNARFGDPEAMNVLSILETDMVAISEAIIDQKLEHLQLTFAKKATVCKYAVPEGYPTDPVRNKKVEVPEQEGDVKIYYASVDQRDDGLYMTGSRAIAFVGIGDTISEAEEKAEKAVSSVKGKVFHRKDIATAALLQKRMDHMKEISK